VSSFEGRETYQRYGARAPPQLQLTLILSRMAPNCRCPHRLGLQTAIFRGLHAIKPYHASYFSWAPVSWGSEVQSAHLATVNPHGGMNSTCAAPPVGLQDRDRGEFARIRAAAGPTGTKLLALSRLMAGTVVTILALHPAPRRAPPKSSSVPATPYPTSAMAAGLASAWMGTEKAKVATEVLDCGHGIHPCFAQPENGDGAGYI